MRKWSIVVVAAVAMVGAGCGSSNSSAPTTTVAKVTTASTPAYGSPGPYVTGETTIDLGIASPVYGERFATVFYPSSMSAAQAATEAQFSYTQAQTLPAAAQGLLPPKYNLTTTVPAYPNAPASTAGPFPVVLFDFGASGQRLFYSNLLSGIASWGYVVVAADYFEHSIASQVLAATSKQAAPAKTPAARATAAALDLSVMYSSLDAAITASSDPSSVLHGTVNASEVATIGHSAGGQTAFDALRSPRITTAIGWSPVGPLGPASSKPVMIIRPAGDKVITSAWVDPEYAAFSGPKSYVEPAEGGHNTYTDLCVVIRNGGGLIQYAIAAHFVTPKLAQLGFNGCEANDVAPPLFWQIVQYYTVFQLRAYLGGQAKTVPVPAPGAFHGIGVTVKQAS